MSTNQLLIVAGVIVALLILPVIIALLVRLLIKDEPPEEEDIADSVTDFTSIGDFWQGMAPHLLELRDRLVKCLLAVGVGASLAFWAVNTPSILGKPLPNFMVDQLAPGTQLQAIQVGEVFIGYMRIALVLGVALAMPVIIYQLVAFFSPGLLPHEKRIVFTALPFVTQLFLAGLAFGWFITVPAALQFLLNFGTITTVPTLDSFMGTVATLLLWNGVIFELPAVIFLLARLGIVHTQMLARTRRYALVIIAIIAALITPTGDPYNLLLLAVPMYLLYELGILLSRFVPKKKDNGAVAAAA
ncbi:MAG TPA: twin-arginine translocase subunit TatC [Roseiflexaceae bacterium]|nr:twin-arginine translocase subunit TatC [Roseiflexaceae bacterium]